MQQLLADPQSLKFLKEGAINMHTLKKQIDRRVRKVRALVMGCAFDHDTNIKRCNEMGCQTEVLHKGETSNNVKLRHHRVLSSHDSNIPHSAASIYQERPSLPNKKKAVQAKEHSLLKDENANVRVRVADYLTSKKGRNADYPCLISSPSEDDQIEEVQRSQEDKIFTAVQFELHNSLKTFDSLMDYCSPQFQIPFTRNPSLESQDVSQSEGGQGRKSFSTVARKLTSVRKMRFTDRTALPQSDTARIVVSEECMNKMANDMEEIIGKKRRQPSDNKLRLNIIKKVEEKYGEYYDNI